MNESIKYWLALNKITGLGPVTIKKLWQHFGSVKAFWEADERSILEIEEINRPAVRSFLENRGQINFETELEAVSKNKINILTLEDGDYPEGLRNIYDPPPVLYIKGNILKADSRALAIVGTRKASRYGLEIAGKLAYELASLGITIVSGLASGIDTSAHKGALEAKGRTIAVFGCGIDIIFPRENRNLAKAIEGSGALVSEFPLGTGPDKGNFPRRNRIISGLSVGVIVVEGHFDSGAMITAKFASDQGREVFAVPGNIDLDQSKGPHWLIKQGAKLVENVDDILEELKMVIPGAESSKQKAESRKQVDYSSLDESELKIIKALSTEPKHIDDISNSTGLPIQEVSSLLMMLEVKGFVKQLPGKTFVVD
ncbi:MAG: DNA-processing protein DprA [Candidatus Saganbacteria bacterium]|nr:DNA-processing protein DprA [Candidatus Saganbacteria bacterium]